MKLPLTFTSGALKKIRETINQKSIPEFYGVRIGIRGGGGCGSGSYLFGFDKKRDDDDTWTLDGLEILIAKKHVMYVAGLEVGYEEREEERGFVFKNPKL